MTDLILTLLVGAFIGWSVPQPFWAVWLQNWVMEKLRNFGNSQPK